MLELIELVSLAFMVGFLAQTHCVGMCGPIIGILGINNAYKRIPAAIFYNLGRISTYVFLGVIAGLLGAVISDITTIQYIIRYLAGIIMIFIALQLFGLPQFLGFIEKPAQLIWNPIRKLSLRLFPIKSALGTYTVGLIWGFLPCGAVYGPLAVAMGTGNITTSAAMMFAFGVGTLPVMLSLAIFGNFVGRYFAKASVRRIAGLIVLAMSIYYLGFIAPKDRVMKKADREQQKAEMIKSGKTEATQVIKELSSGSHGNGHNPKMIDKESNNIHDNQMPTDRDLSPMMHGTK